MDFLDVCSPLILILNALFYLFLVIYFLLLLPHNEKVLLLRILLVIEVYNKLKWTSKACGDSG